jgi:hypothetical protein
MAENKTVPTKASVTAFLDTIEDPTRRADAKALVKIMKNATGEKAVMWGPAIVGFGSHHYRYETGREGDMPIAAFSPRKGASVLYITTKFEGAEALLGNLGKHTMGKGCLYIKKLADVDAKVLESLIAQSVAARREQQAE